MQTAPRGDLFLAPGGELIRLFKVKLLPGNSTEINTETEMLAKFGMDEARYTGIINSVREELAAQFDRD